MDVFISLLKLKFSYDILFLFFFFKFQIYILKWYLHFFEMQDKRSMVIKLWTIVPTTSQIFYDTRFPKQVHQKFPLKV